MSTTLEREGLRGGGPASVHATAGLSVTVSDQPDDPEWDDFLEALPGGNFLQASCWGRARAAVGWRPVRAVVRQDDRVVAGAQMETRPMPALGRIGFVRRGPVVADDAPQLAAMLVDAMLSMGAANNVGYLVVQTPSDCASVQDEMARRGFREGPFDIDLEATVRMSDSEIDTMFAALSQKCRANVRAGLRQGVTVREGSEADLPIFNRLKDIQSARLGYDRRSDEYYAELWKALAPRGCIKLFITEYEGEPVTAQLAVAFGDTMHHIERPWSGEHGNAKPNEVTVWEVLRWAVAEGYRSSDLYGIPRYLAESVLSGREIPLDSASSAYRFKLKFGGDVIVSPPSYHYVFNPVLRVAYRAIPAPIMKSAWMNRLACRFRAGGS